MSPNRSNAVRISGSVTSYLILRINNVRVGLSRCFLSASRRATSSRYRPDARKPIPNVSLYSRMKILLSVEASPVHAKASRNGKEDRCEGEAKFRFDSLREKMRETDILVYQNWYFDSRKVCFFEKVNIVLDEENVPSSQPPPRPAPPPRL